MLEQIERRSASLRRHANQLLEVSGLESELCRYGRSCCLDTEKPHAVEENVTLSDRVELWRSMMIMSVSRASNRAPPFLIQGMKTWSR